jgi:hypothetical protein
MKWRDDMINKFLKKSAIILALSSFATMSFGMDKATSSIAEKIDVKNILISAAVCGFEAFNFTLGNGRFLYDGMQGIRSFFKKSDDKNVVSLAELDKLPYTSPQVKDAIRSATTKMCMSPDTLIGISISVTRSPASAHNRTIWIDPNLFPLYAPDEQEAIIGHECSHIINKDTPLARSFANLAAPVVSYALLKGYEYGANKLLDAAQINLSSGNDGVSKTVSALKIVNAIVSYHFVPRYLLNLYLVSRVTQHQEKRSDVDSAWNLKNPQGLINFFNKIQTPEIVKSNEAIAKEVDKAIVRDVSIVDRTMLGLKNMDGLFGMPEHPSRQERTKALEEIKKKLNQ